MKQETQKTLLIAHEHPIFRLKLKLILAAVDWLRVIAEAESGDSALAQIRHIEPDIVMLDLAMPGLDGLSVLDKAKEKYPDLTVITVTSYIDRAHMDRSLELGASAYVVKDEIGDDLLCCLEAVNRGETYISPSLVRDSILLPIVEFDNVVSPEQPT